MGPEIRQRVLDEDEHVFAVPWRGTEDWVLTLEERRLAQEAAAFLRAIIPDFRASRRRDAVIIPLPRA